MAENNIESSETVNSVGTPQTPPQAPAPVAPSSDSQPPKQPKSKAPLIIGIVLGILMLVLIVLLIMLVGKDDSDKNDKQSNASSSQSEKKSQGTTIEKKRVIQTYDTSQDGIVLDIYDIDQNSTNTTVNYALRADTNGVSADAFSALGLNSSKPEDTYIIENNSAQRYDVLTNSEDKPVATNYCGKSQMKKGDKIDCFIAFTKVPSGSTISIVMGANAPKIDGVKLP